MLSNPTEVRPFRVDVPEAELAELRRRIAATRWPEKEPVDDLSQGVQLAAIQALARYWETEYDFGRLEARLSGLPQFMTERLSGRAVSSAAELGRTGLPQPHLLPRGRQGRPLRGLGTAATLFRRSPRGLQLCT